MSSRLRYVVRLKGGWYVGTDAWRWVTHWIGHPVKGLPALKKAVALLGGQLYVFREPRNISYTRSRYKKLCNYLGFGKRRKVAAIPAPQEYHIPQAVQQGINAVLGGQNDPNVQWGQAAPQPPDDPYG